MTTPTISAMTNGIGLSIVIPLYNKAHHIKRAINSVLAQSYTNYELIIVDDGSTDGSSELVRQMTDPRIRLIAQPNGGTGAARNTGILEARAELVAFLDADDEWLPNFLETVMGLQARHPTAGIFATAYRNCLKGETVHIAFLGCVASPEGGLLEDYFRAALGPPPICASAVMIPKPVLAEVNFFPVGIKLGEDLETWAAIALRHRVAWSPVEGAVYNLSATNRACLFYPLPMDVRPAVPVEAFLAGGMQPISSRFYAEEYLTRLRLEVAKAHLLAGQRAWVRRLVQKTAGTVLFQKKRWVLRLMFWIPTRLLRVMAGTFRNIRGLMGR
jgi:glycosyltransferase involved in cell wall biosynthesis